MAQPEDSETKPFVHPQAGHAKKKKAPPPYYIQTMSALYLFFGAALAGALFAPIQDCDETFNYWEPTHYLSHGYGLQTWEYSPDYSIRSWLYITLHAIVANIRRITPQSNKVSEFYFVRYVLAFVCALCQTLLWKVIASTLHPRIGIIFMVATIFSPGNWHAAAAYLPSSFAMYTTMLGVAAFMNWRGGLKTAQGIAWFALGGVVGWPFAAALCLPFMFEELVLMMLGDKDSILDGIVRVGRGVVAGLVILSFDTAINAFFYKKVVVVPWNIVKYNIFSSSGGPDLYGTEPWTFYFRNLALNFNIWFVLALLAGPLFLMQKIFGGSKHGFISGLRTIVFLSPFYMWLAIFTSQPHKEERFMYPAYPLLALNAAVSTHIILTAMGHTLRGKIMASIKLSLVALTLLLSIDIGLARVYGLWSAYSAPLRLYSPLWENPQLGGYAQNVCFGKEWYRFPSSYFLPNDMHAKWVRSEFRGMLPGDFSEARTGFGFWSGTWLPTSGLNDRNEEDMGKYVELRNCHFLVDTQYNPERGDEEALPPNEPDYVTDEEHWEVVNCVPFMDAARTPAVARVIWVPDWPFVPERIKRKWGQHCLLKRKAAV